MFQSSPPITSFFSNKIQSTDPDFDEYLIDIANIFAEFDGQIYDYEAVTDRFRQLSDRPIDKERDPSDFRDEYGAYGSFLGIIKVIYENNRWVWRLSAAASKLLCGDEPNVRAFLRLQLSLLQYPLLTGVAYLPQSLRIQSNALDSMQKMIESEIRIVPLRLILKSLKVKSHTESSNLSETLISYKEIFFLFNNPATSTNPNPSSEQIREILDVSKNNPIFVDDKIFKKFYRNFHIFNRTGIISKLENGLMVNLKDDIETSLSKQRMVDVIAEMNGFCEEFYHKTSELAIKDHLHQMARESAWSKYYDGGQLPQDIYSNLVLDLPGSIDIPQEELKDTSQRPIEISSVPANAPPLVDRQSLNSPARSYRSVNSTADPEVTRLKREKSNTYHRFLVNLMTSRLQWWINYLIDDRGINVIWLEGEINLACTSSCHELIKRLVDRIEE
jgi:hypothetical protein